MLLTTEILLNFFLILANFEQYIKVLESPRCIFTRDKTFVVDFDSHTEDEVFLKKMREKELNSHCLQVCSFLPSCK